MDKIIEFFKSILTHEYKWFLVALVIVVVFYLIMLMIPCKKRKDSNQKNDIKKETFEEKENIEKNDVEEKKEESVLTQEVVEEKNENVDEISENVVEDIKEDSEDKKVKSLGKWLIKKKSEQDYILTLVANNGEIILASESHNTAVGAKNSLQTLKKNIEKDNFQLYSDKNNQYFFKLKDGANKLLAMGQVYTTKKSAQNSINSVKRFFNAEISEEIIEDVLYIKYTSKEINVEGVKDAYKGKWIISKFEDLYQAKLHASNGEVILVTERYSSLNSVYSAIETIKKNAELGNFIIDCDKNKKYFYRLRNVNKLTLAIGETYDKATSVSNNIDSVRRFCMTAEITEKLEETEEK